MGEKKSQEDETQIINHVSGVQYPLCHVVKVLKKGDIIQDIFPDASCRIASPIQHPKKEQCPKSQYSGDDLILGQ